MKKLTFLLLSFSFIITLSAQEFNLDVEGNAKLRGRLDISAADGDNIYIGRDAGKSSAGNFNSFIGLETGISSEGHYNTFVGFKTGNLNTNGYANTFLGAATGVSNTSGYQNVFIGVFAGEKNTTGDSNTFIGTFCGTENTTGKNNTFAGYGAGYSNTDGEDNTFLGFTTGNNNTIGRENTFIGKAAGNSNTEGHENTFIGDNAGNGNVEAEDNTFVGQDSGPFNTGADNTFLGQGAGFRNTTGNRNTFLGELAGQNNMTGSDNTAIGQNASFTSGEIENSFGIGANALITQSHSGFIGNISTQHVRTYVNLATASDKRLKKNIQEDVKGLDFILELRPVSYQYDAQKMDNFLRKESNADARKADTPEQKEYLEELLTGQENYQKALAEKSKIRYNGFLAQNVEKAAKKSDYEFSGLVQPTSSQDHYSLRYAEFVVPLVKAVQEQQAIIDNKQIQIENLQNQVADLEKKFEQLENLLLSEVSGQNNPSSATRELVQQQIKLTAPYLAENRPNPFIGQTIIPYFLPETIQQAQIQINNINGKVLKVETIQGTGHGQLVIDAKALPQGTYSYSLLVDGQLVETKRMVKIKK